jgi:integrase
MKELAEKFIEDHILRKNKPSTAKEHTRLVNVIIVPALGQRIAKDVTPGDISTLLLRLGKHTPTQANRVRSVLSKMFNAAEMWSIRPRNSNPVKGQERNQETKKDRNLSDKELVALGETLREIDAALAAGGPVRPSGPGSESPFAMAAIRLAILTGMRKAEMVGDGYKGIAPMEWSEVDLEAGIITIPATRHKTGRKAGARIIHLCAEARQILEAMPRPLNSNLVFPGDRPGHPISNLLKVFNRIQGHVATTQFKKPAAERIDLSGVTLHDLRRTFGSVGARLGVPELFISALLGHAAGTVTQVYARINGDPLNLAAENIGAHIHGLLSGSDLMNTIGNLEKAGQTANGRG